MEQANCNILRCLTAQNKKRCSIVLNIVASQRYDYKCTNSSCYQGSSHVGMG
jgi:hypothetical protein